MEGRGDVNKIAIRIFVYCCLSSQFLPNNIFLFRCVCVYTLKIFGESFT